MCDAGAVFGYGYNTFDTCSKCVVIYVVLHIPLAVLITKLGSMSWLTENKSQTQTPAPTPASSWSILKRKWPDSLLNKHCGAVVLQHRNTGTLSLNRGLLVSGVYGNKQLCNKWQGKVWDTGSVSTAGYGPHKTRRLRVNPENRDLHRWRLLCVAPAGSWGARPRWDHPAWSCHPHPSLRWGASAGWRPASSFWSCAPVCVMK